MLRVLSKTVCFLNSSQYSCGNLVFIVLTRQRPGVFFSGAYVGDTSTFKSVCCVSSFASTEVLRLSHIYVIFNSFRKFSMDIQPKKMDLGAMRVPYEPQIERDFSSKNPIILFDKWFNDARKTDGIREANAMAVATADKQGKPSVRYVLLKSYAKEGFIFYSNYNSRKGQEIAENPQVALLMYWEPLCRQVRIEGSIDKISQKESEEYFHSRPKSSQFSAVISNQSKVIENKEELIKKRDELEQKYADESAVIPKPNHWGGYLVKPDSFEFWCGRSNRLHERMRFRRLLPNEIPDEKKVYSGEDGWVYEYLAP